MPLVSKLASILSVGQHIISNGLQHQQRPEERGGIEFQCALLVDSYCRSWPGPSIAGSQRESTPALTGGDPDFYIRHQPLYQDRFLKPCSQLINLHTMPRYTTRLQLFVDVGIKKFLWRPLKTRILSSIFIIRI